MSKLDFRGRRVAGVPVLAGAVNGALTFLAGLLVAFFLYASVGIEVTSRFASEFGAISIPAETGATFAFFGGHFVSVRLGDGATTNFALSAVDSGFLFVVLAVGMLGAAGYYLGSAEYVHSTDDGFRAGASLAVGYLPLVAWTASAVRFEGSGVFWTAEPMTVEIPFVRAVVLAGVVVPVVIGGVGGALATRS